MQEHWAFVLGAIFAGCSTGPPCDPDQRLSGGVCYGPDAPAATADADLRFAHLGDTCTLAADCAAPASFCVILPGAPSGYCTATGCLADPTVCPAEWACMDLSVYQAGLPAICTQP